MLIFFTYIKIDCADLDVVKQQFSKDTYEMALSVSGGTEV